nr:MAG TPA: stabilization protein [Caudoviricetes sp.]
MKLTIPAQPTYRHIYYENLRGADFSRDRTEVNGRRSPDMLNLISDNGGNPIKRLGWRKVTTFENSGKIEKILLHKESVGAVKYVLAEKGIFAVYNNSEGAETITTLVSYNTLDCADLFLYNDTVYAFANGKLYKFKDLVAEDVIAAGTAKIPEVSISRNPDGSGGVSLEGVNLLTPKRIFSFLGNSSAKEYSLVPEKLKTNDFYKYIVADSIKVEVMDKDGEFKEQTKDTDYTIGEITVLKGKNVLGEVTDFNVCAPKITFTAAHAPTITGQDNVKITFENFDATEDHKETEGETETIIYKGQYKENRADLLKTFITKAYGYSKTDRIFAVGGVNKNRVYYTGVDDPTYWPDNNYFIAGQDGNDIVGLHVYSSYLAVIKGDTNTETTVYLAYGQILNNETYFAVKPTMGGEGGIAPKTFATLGDDPLFLTRNGVFAITNVFATTDNVLRNRSYFVDKRLIEEDNLESSAAVVWRRYYILCVNGHCYVLDGRQKSTDNNNTTNYSYECYYWENIPATCFFVYENELWFGTADGYLCKFNTDISDNTAYCDDGTLALSTQGEKIITGGTAISCRWSTPLDDYRMPQYFKTLNKKGSLLTLLPYDKTSAIVTLIADGDREYPLGIFYADIFTWDPVDFDRFTFSSNETAQDDFFNKKVKRYRRLQVIVENTAIYEPFGLLKITETYTVGNFSKNRG